MEPQEVSRRDFHKLSSAALCGLIAGTAFGCADQAAPPAKTASNATPASAAPATDLAKSPVPPPAAATKSDAKGTAAVTTVALHACRGLNECKSLGKSKKNDCAGKGDCYTATAHDCSGQNDCKYQGGCGTTHGVNDCKGKGGCGHYPITDAAWKKARVAFESREKAAGKKFGPAPTPTKT
jgi:hypothetical protein